VYKQKRSKRDDRQVQAKHLPLPTQRGSRLCQRSS
jgi:hypothetical protein